MSDKRKTCVFTTVDGCTLSALHWGADLDQGVPVVLLHSLFFDGTMFEATVNSFAGSHYCIAPDHRGQGASALGQNAPSMSQLANDVVALLDHLDIPRVHLVGSSMGGYVALEIMRDHGDRVASLTLSCCTGQAEANPDRFEALAQSFQAPRAPNMAHKLAALMFGPSFAKAPSPPLEYWHDRFSDLPEHMATVVRGVFSHDDFTPVLDRITCPVLLIAGAEDQAKSPADLKWIQAHISGQAEYAIINDAGHTPPVETPARYSALIRDFIHRSEITSTRQDCA